MALFTIKKRNGIINTSPELNQWVEFALVDHSYKQGYSGAVASLFCATVVFFGLRHHGNLSVLTLWFLVAIFILVLRMILVKIYLAQNHPEQHMILWRNLFTIGATLVGATWGFVGWFIFPQVGNTQQTLCILIIAGVTAGAVPLLSALLDATILFLLISIFPLIFSVITQQTIIYELFDLTLMVYLIYLIMIAHRTNLMTRNVMQLQFENEELINEMSDINKKLDLLATHDPLTHVANTTLFYHELSIALEKASRRKSSLALLFIDLDKFKQANDHYGHQTGDKVLLLVIDKLQKAIRSRDLIARMGGDEFVIMLEEISSIQNVETVAKKICEAIAAPMYISGAQIEISASIGISFYPDNGIDIDTLIKNADNAMYYSKNHGGNSYQLYSTLQQHL